MLSLARAAYFWLRERIASDVLNRAAEASKTVSRKEEYQNEPPRFLCSKKTS
jgi:hypothetical protein